MKVILLMMLVLGAAVSSIAGPCSSWRSEARHARLEVYRIQREARRSAFAARVEMQREKQQMLREMRQQRLEMRREMRDSFRWR